MQKQDVALEKILYARIRLSVMKACALHLAHRQLRLRNKKGDARRPD